MSSPRPTDMVQITRWHMRPDVISWMRAKASSMLGAVSVARNSWARSRLKATGSTATILRAPAIRAP